MKVKVFFKVKGRFYSKPRICIKQIEAVNEEDACYQAFEFEAENNARELVCLQFPDKFLFWHNYAAHCYFGKGRISFDEFIQCLSETKPAHFFNTLKYRLIDLLAPLKNTWVYEQVEHLRLCRTIGVFNRRIFFRCFFRCSISVNELPWAAIKRAFYEYHVANKPTGTANAPTLYHQRLVRTSLFNFKLPHTSLYYDFCANELD